MNHEATELFHLHSGNITRQEFTNNYLAQMLCLLPLNTINDLRRHIRLQIVNNHRNLFEEWLLERYYLCSNQPKILPHSFIEDEQLNLASGSGSGIHNCTLNANPDFNLYQLSDQNTWILPQQLLWNDKATTRTHDAHCHTIQSLIVNQNLNTETNKENNSRTMVTYDITHCNKGKRNPIYTFPHKLHEILSDPINSEYITWLPHGRAWKVVRRTQFERDILPLHFRHSRYSSFMRQVSNLIHIG
jgi:hypothetical protein